MIGRTIAHYRILEKLGAGSAGVVYKARDQKHDRLVALKILTGLGSEEAGGPSELRQEASVPSTLHHPNIAEIYDRGVAEGSLYLVFEYLPGGTLREKIRQFSKTGLIPLEQVISYASQVAAGLDHAHRQGVFHRALSSGNIMLTAGGSVKITDFGLAKWATSGRTTGAAKESKTRKAFSPEQAQGREADERSDIYCFGLLLFELIAGREPYPSASPGGAVDDVVGTPTPSLVQDRPGVPETLERIVRKATEKAPDDRFQSVAELMADLRNWQQPEADASEPPAPVAPRAKWLRRYFLGAGAAAALVVVLQLGPRFGSEGPRQPPVTGTRPLSIAVLPLKNLSDDPSHEYLADGMTDALISDLAKIQNLRVISRTSVMQYKNTAQSLPEIARDLRVERVVDGTVYRVGDQVRITARLIDVASDAHLWAESYQRDADDVLALQRDVARAIADEVEVQLSDEDRQRLAAARQVNPQAYDAYLRGRYQALRWTPDGFRNSIALFQRATELDPNYAAAYAGLAFTYGLLALSDALAPDEAWPIARDAAERAVKMDDSSENAAAALAFVKASYDWDFPAAEKEFLRAMELNPGSVDTHHAYALTYLASVGRTPEAVAVMERAEDLDPRAVAIITNLGDAYMLDRQYERASGQFRKALELNPGFSDAFYGLALVNLGQGRNTEAARDLRKAHELAPRPFLPVFADAVEGNRSATLQGIRGLLELSKQRYVSPCHLAIAYTWIGDHDQAFEWLDRAYEEHSARLLHIKVTPVYDPLRSDPRFADLLRRMKLE